MATYTINLQEFTTIINEKNWDQLLEYVKPKYFVRQDLGELFDTAILAQICQLLINEDTPHVVKILCLKCLGNSCLDNYKYKRHALENKELDKYSKSLYDKLSKNNLCEYEKDCDYSYNSHFPYGGVVEWAVDYITNYSKSINYLNDNELDIFRLCIQFLCNLFTYAGKDTTSIDDNILKYLNCNNLKETIVNSMHSEYKPLAKAACIFIHNALKELNENYFTSNDKCHLSAQLLKPINEGYASAKDALLYILHHSDVLFEVIYNSMTMKEKLDLLEIIYNELWETTCQNADFYPVLTNDAVEFIALTFCKRSDLILKTVDTYMDNIDPTEVILILNILGLLTSMQYKILENAKNLIINCKFLLLSLHLMGKKSDNFFTPITNLSKLVTSTQRRPVNKNSASNVDATEETIDPQNHPAYGFKAGIIKIIGNMAYRNKMCQDLFREIDGIPLLLDCCNIDARNPLILQWTILALRNLCEGNVENQEIIKNCKKTGQVDNPMLEEMGLTLHEDADGKSIRIVSLPRD